jgi:hypothetical protein
MLALVPGQAHDLLFVSAEPSDLAGQSMAAGSGDVLAALIVAAVLVATAVGRALAVLFALLRQILGLLLVLGVVLAILLTLAGGLLSGDDQAAGPPSGTSTSSSIPPMGDLLPPNGR